MDVRCPSCEAVETLNDAEVAQSEVRYRCAGCATRYGVSMRGIRVVPPLPAGKPSSSAMPAFDPLAPAPLAFSASDDAALVRAVSIAPGAAAPQDEASRQPSIAATALDVGAPAARSFRRRHAATVAVVVAAAVALAVGLRGGDRADASARPGAVVDAPEAPRTEALAPAATEAEPSPVVAEIPAPAPQGVASPAADGVAPSRAARAVEPGPSPAARLEPAPSPAARLEPALAPDPDVAAPGEPAPAAVSERDVDRAALASAMGSGAGAAAACAAPDGPHGPGRVTVTFASTGRVMRALVESGPYLGTSAGSCVALAFRGVTIPPFDGPPVAVHTTVTLR